MLDESPIAKPFFYSPFTGFSLLPMNTTAKVGLSIRLDCQPVDDSIVRWARENAVVDQGNCPGCNTLQNGSLYIQNVEMSHDGKYTCFIPPGNSFFSVYLTVTSRRVI